MDTRTGTVIVVDDEPGVLKICETILRRGGFETLTASGANEALSLLQDNPCSVDFALLDVMMPVMNGVELAARIGETNPDIRIVLMSGYSPRQILPLIGTRPYALLGKPFTAETLLQTIDKVAMNPNPPL